VDDVSDTTDAALLDLQDADTAIDQLAHRRRHLPERERLGAAVSALRDLERTRDGLRAEVDSALAEIAECERESSEIDTQRARLSAQLRTVIAPREAEALQHEIATLEERRSGLDDRALVAMDTQASVEAALSDIILFGTEEHVRLAAQAASDLAAGRPIHTADLVTSLRRYIRLALDLEPIPVDVTIPLQGPTRPQTGSSRKHGGDSGRDKGAAGEGGGGGTAMGMGSPPEQTQDR
jgi:hypothetical protein